MNVAQAKALHLKEVLSRLGHEAKRETNGESWYLSPFRKEADASFKLTRDGKGWYDHGAGQGGNILDFVILYFNLPENGIREALERLDELWGGVYPQIDLYAPETPSSAISEPVQIETDTSSSLEMESIRPLRRKGLIRYLSGRGIPLKLAQPYVQQMDYRYEGRRYYALAFANDGGDYELRNAYFKGCYGKKDISTLRVEASDAVAVFEGFMDFLSAVAYAGRAPRQQVIVLNSGTMRERAVTAIQALNVQRVDLWLDHDRTGRTMTRFFRDVLIGCQVVDASGLYEGYKDFNDYWMARHEQATA